MTDFFNAIGGAICHRLPSRTICISGIYLPVCARCTGIYMSAAISFLLYLAFGRLRGNRPPDMLPAVITVLCIAPFMIDGAGSYAGLWASDNFRRIITGALGGFPIITLIILGLNFDACGENDSDILKNAGEPLVFIGFSLAAAFMTYIGQTNYIVASLAIVFGIFIVFGGIIAVAAKNIRRALNDKKRR